jgi:tRNA-dihydrouridine synthase A
MSINPSAERNSGQSNSGQSNSSMAQGSSAPYHRFSVAPMMDRTDRHCRYFLRQISQRTLMYSEMVTTQAILHGDRAKLLGYDGAEHPVALQLGGDQPQHLATCARIAQDLGYDEVNLNVGCPSARVQDGNFGACLMLQPQRVADCVSAMVAAVDIPVTVKHRIGVDERDRYEELAEFVSIVHQSGCDRFSVHARKAWLQGLSPKENRSVPPLRYDLVHQLKRDFPALKIELNGGILTLAQAVEQLSLVDAVMVGRAAYDQPYDLLATADQDLWGDSRAPRSRREVIEAMLTYTAEQTEQGTKFSSIARHMLQLFVGVVGTRAWKQTLTAGGVGSPQGEAAAQVLLDALAAVEVMQQQQAERAQSWRDLALSPRG